MKKKEKSISIKSVVHDYAPEKKYLYPVTIVMSIVSGAMQIVPFYLLYRLIGQVITTKGGLSKQIVYSYALYIFLTQVAGVVATFISGLSSHMLAFRIEKNMRKIGVNHLMKLPVGFFENEDSGRLRRVIDDNASKTHTFLAHIFPDLASAMIIPLILIGFFVVIDIRLGIVALVGVILSVFFMSRMMNKEMQEMMSEYSASAERLNVSGVEYIRGIPIVKVFNQSVESFQKFHDSIMDYDKKAREIVFFFKRPMILAMVSLFLPALLLGPVCLLLLPGSSDPVGLIVKCVFYVLISFLFQSAFMRIMTINEGKTVYQVSVEKLREILAIKPMEKVEVDDVQEKGIIFKDVHFTYPGRKKEALAGINEQFTHGTSYALVGESGSGKSTLMKLIARMYDPDKGSITIDGRDVRSFDVEDLYEKMSIVFQESSLLKTTLRENVTMGKDYPDDEIIRALKEAGCEDLLERLNGDLDTFIGTGGTFVSGGEAQRISIARAFLKDSPILLLDEASAYVDAENEYLIQKSIDRLKANRLTISIAHRMSSIQNADKILVFDDGKITDTGTHAELMQRSERYRHLSTEYARSIEWKIDVKGESYA